MSLNKKIFSPTEEMKLDVAIELLYRKDIDKKRASKMSKQDPCFKKHLLALSGRFRFLEDISKALNIVYATNQKKRSVVQQSIFVHPPAARMLRKLSKRYRSPTSPNRSVVKTWSSPVKKRKRSP